jgi:hypothetical protein
MQAVEANIASVQGGALRGPILGFPNMTAAMCAGNVAHTSLIVAALLSGQQYQALKLDIMRLDLPEKLSV